MSIIITKNGKQTRYEDQLRRRITYPSPHALEECGAAADLPSKTVP